LTDGTFLWEKNAEMLKLIDNEPRDFNLSGSNFSHYLNVSITLHKLNLGTIAEVKNYIDSYNRTLKLGGSNNFYSKNI